MLSSTILSLGDRSVIESGAVAATGTEVVQCCDDYDDVAGENTYIIRSGS